MRKSVSRVRKDHRSDIVISATDPLEELIKKKVGENPDTFSKLTKRAFGWNQVNGNDPILIIDPANKATNREFGVAVYTLHNLFVNKFKHERGQDTFQWFEDVSEDEKVAITTEMFATIGLMYRLIEKAEISEKVTRK